MNELERKLPPLPLALKNEILEKGLLKSFPAGTEILRVGQYVNFVPFVLEGSVKVSSSHSDKELLLYYIEPSESCIMSFSAGLANAPSRVFAVAEEDTKILLLPIEFIPKWGKDYPAFNNLFFKQFNQRYDDLLHTIEQLLFVKMDKRLFSYLKEKSLVLGTPVLNLRHHQIARELGTAREVVSRVLKKLEQEKKLRQLPNGIEIL